MLNVYDFLCLRNRELRFRFFRLLLFSYYSTPIERKSCAELLQDGWNSSGVYTINPDGGNSIQMLCDMTTESGGWTVFQRRLDSSVDFYRGWEFYKNGFGNLSGEFWLGNDNTHRLTDSDDVILRVDLRWQTRPTSISFQLEITEVPLVTAWLGDIP